MKRQRLVYTTIMAVGTVVGCGLLSACGNISRGSQSRVTVTRAGAKGRLIRGIECAQKLGVEISGGAVIHTPSSMTGDQLDGVLKRCGFVRAKASSESALGARAKSNLRVISMAEKFATCMRQNGVDIPRPNPKADGPLI